ncbi:transport permease protein [Alteromonas halophila]|uniref:Transport permease protein n=2 Tax=Alteromonas halophila TaxID=516698 RepID=A0A918JJC5_9ALTE|nr:transport permease protein [Alteromonas halophila]
MNLKAEAAQSQLNYLWWLLEPALFIGVYYVVFGIFLNSRTDDFIAFLICGKIPFLWFSRSVSNASNSLVAGGGLMNQINIPKLFFPVVVIAQDLVKTFVVFLLMLSIMWLMGYMPNPAWWAIIPVALTQLLFVSSLAILFSALVPFLPDLKFIVGTFIILMMFASGIFYDPAQFLRPEHRELFMLNPLAYVISEYRAIIMEGELPQWAMLARTAVVSLIGLGIAITIIKAFDSRYPRQVLQ